MSFSVQPIEVFSTSASAHCYDVNKSETISAIDSVKMNKLQTSNNADEEDQDRRRPLQPKEERISLNSP